MKLRHDMLTHGVYVVCAQHKGRRGGLAVAWATQVATSRILICVGAQSATRELILDSQAFGLSALTREQLDVARAFGRRSSRDVDKFASLGTHTLETGSPLLDDCAATFDCRVEAVYDLDSQKLIVGRIAAAERLKEEYEPLIYREEDY
ncbi:MAG: flavin reductase [Anaerolineae bacterium]|nr:MAG: flavin reductase [Anaerolineae bacterium]